MGISASSLRIPERRNSPAVFRRYRMSHRAVALMFLAALIAAAVLVPAPLAAQTANAVKVWTPPKTADGVPDLQGVYSNATAVPFERPRNLGAKEFYTEEEMAERTKAAAAAAAARANAEADPNIVHYDLGQFGLNQRVTASTNRTSQIIGAEGTIPALLPAAQARVAAKQAAARGHNFDDAQHRGLSERCIMWGNEGPPMLSPGYNSDVQIVQGTGYVAILQEMIHDTRIIPTDGSAHLPSDVRLWMGDSRGHWDGNTLVVDTTNFTDKTGDVGAGMQRATFRGSDDKLRLIERFTLVDPDTILYEFTVDDPTAFTNSWTAQLPMMKTSGPLFEYACHEGNYAMTNVLGGARAQEKKNGEDAVGIK